MPSWGFLGLMGLIGGGPTFLGTLIGQVWVSPALETVFFAVAGGSILYVVIQLFDVCKRYGMPKLVSWMLLARSPPRLRHRLGARRRRRVSVARA